MMQDLVELIIESNQELPTWLEAMSMDSRNNFGSRRGGKSRFGGTGFGAKDVRYENGGGKRTNERGSERGFGGSNMGGWSGPPGLKPNFGGNYGGSTSGDHDWWDS